MPPRINKFLVSAAATIGVVANATADGNVTQHEFIGIVAAVIGTILVYVVPNHPNGSV